MTSISALTADTIANARLRPDGMRDVTAGGLVEPFDGSALPHGRGA